MDHVWRLWGLFFTNRVRAVGGILNRKNIKEKKEKQEGQVTFENVALDTLFIAFFAIDVFEFTFRIIFGVEQQFLYKHYKKKCVVSQIIFFKSNYKFNIINYFFPLYGLFTCMMVRSNRWQDWRNPYLTCPNHKLQVKNGSYYINNLLSIILLSCPSFWF